MQWSPPPPPPLSTHIISPPLVFPKFDLGSGLRFNYTVTDQTPTLLTRTGIL